MTKKYKILSWIGIAITIAVFVLVNVFMTILTKKMPLKIDLTENKMYDLTAESYEYLKSYDKDTTIYIISTVVDQDYFVRNVLDRYEAANSHIKITNVDTVKNPGFGREYVKDGEQLNQKDLVVVSGDKSIIIQGLEITNPEDDKSPKWLNVETKVTSALKYVSRDSAFSTCYITGHREDSFDSAKEALDSENYTSFSINLLSDNIPEDTSVVIIALPKTDFSSSEIAKLDAYVRAGGALEVYVDSECPELPELNKYLAANGITISESKIYEKDHVFEIQSGDQLMRIFAADYGSNDVFSRIIEKNKLLIYMPFPKSVNITATAGNITVLPYLTSSDNSGTTTDYQSIDSRGSSNIALMSTNSETGGRIYVSGTPMLFDMLSVSDMDLAGYGNVDYFVTVTNSMTGAGDTFVVPVKSVSMNTMNMTVSVRQMYTFILFLLPGIALAVGLIVFFKRRNM